MRRKKRTKQFCDEGWIARRKEEKRQEYIKAGLPVPRWLTEQLEPSKPRQMELFQEGPDHDDGTNPIR